ncbi:MAG: hypothetical protein ACI8UO_001054 [Verrucomicrobiales bacterium]|jgi:hypothetical protein
MIFIIMVRPLTRFAIGAAFFALVSSSFAQEYPSVYGPGQGTIVPPKNLRVAKGLPPMSDLVGKIVQVNTETLQIIVRDRANQIHRFFVPRYSTLTANANLHSDSAALKACLNRLVRIRYIGDIPAPDRFKAIDIFPANS